MEAPKRLGRGLQSLLSTEPKGDVGAHTAPIQQLVPNPRQPREQFDEAALESLSQSIRQHGLLQPIVVRKAAQGFEIIAGERRFRAAQKAGLKEVPIVVRDSVSETEMLELAMLENLQRVDLNPIERARGFAALARDFGKTQDEIARSVGQDRATIANTLRLLELEPEIQEAVQRRAISAGHARALLSVPQPKKRQELFARILSEELSVRQVELAAAMQGAPKKVMRPRRAKSTVSRSPWVHELEDRWMRRLGVRVSIVEHPRSPRVVIQCSSLEELDRVSEIVLTAGPAERH
ncbi:MAG: ParB/RepB/Spo0J family partition protein [Planctomycetes bacterium]|nr:ParB/RepB/Spo0J family partition protein [Planctomycetota bacterium]